VGRAEAAPPNQVSILADSPVRHFEALGAIAERIEQGAVCSCEPGLAAESGQFIVQRGAPVRIEMGRRLVK
jgi:hypothetical protein